MWFENFFRNRQNGGEGAEMPFLDHLEELRWVIVRSVLGILVFMILVFIFKDFVFERIIFAPTKQDFFSYWALCRLSHFFGAGDAMCITGVHMDLINTAPVGQFMLHIKVSMILGFIASFPYIFWQFWRFVKPGLLPKERKYTRGFVVICSLLFLTGCAFGYYVIMPFSITFFQNYKVSDEVQNLISASGYVEYLSDSVLYCGLAFELPVVVYLLSKMGLVTPQFMKRYRKHAYVVIIVLAAVITPSSDVGSLTLVTLPLILLYEFSIFISARILRQKMKADPEFYKPFRDDE